jgi:ribosomal 50S subunit-recycling heat shock protein
LAQEVCSAGAILLNGGTAKGSKLVKSGDLVQWRQRNKILTLKIVKIPGIPPSKKEASALYELIDTQWISEQS